LFTISVVRMVAESGRAAEKNVRADPKIQPSAKQALGYGVDRVFGEYDGRKDADRSGG
jgi:hypothetical protein